MGRVFEIIDPEYVKKGANTKTEEKRKDAEVRVLEKLHVHNED